MRDIEAVLFANDAFYAAFATGDMAAMDDMWMTDGAVSCIHPGWNAQHGREEIMSTWRDILKDQAPEVLCTGAEAYLAGDCAAVVTCYEVIGKSILAATNVFVRDEGRWRIVHHQAGPAALAPGPKVEASSTAIN